MIKWIADLFQDENSQPSITRLITFGAWIISSVAFMKTPTVEMATIYLGIWGGLGGFNKWQEVRPKIAEAQAKAQPPIINQDTAVNNVDASK